ncbi:MAG: hypothetical protein WCP12_13135 [bacterium]
MTLSVWCTVIGCCLGAWGISFLVLPEKMSRVLNALPRQLIVGYVLTAIAWSWAGYALWMMDLDLINPYKCYLPIAVAACIPLTCWWMENLLACRALGAILTLFPYELLHVARVHQSPWRLVLVTFAYICIVKGMVLILYPWQMRRAIVYVTARPWLFRTVAVAHLGLGLLIIVLGASVLK